jgi:hypothetical protein
LSVKPFEDGISKFTEAKLEQAIIDLLGKALMIYDKLIQD